ncbi:MAG: DUF448 domain-containing protein [Polyangiaceae bacterium]
MPRAGQSGRARALRALGPDGSVQPELNKNAGRGAWVHPRPECLRDACRKGFAKSFRAPVTARPETLAALLVSGLVRRSRGLLGAALAARKLAVGASEVKDAPRARPGQARGRGRDARAAAGSSEVEQDPAPARAFATKDELGAITRRNETGVVAVLDAGIAEALEKSIDWASQLAERERGSRCISSTRNDQDACLRDRPRPGHGEQGPGGFAPVDWGRRCAQPECGWA